jgi:hypothetical protein
MFGRQDCALQAHNLKVVSSNLAPATTFAERLSSA